MKLFNHLTFGLIGICFLLVLSSCLTNEESDPENNYVAGEVLFTPKDSVPLEDLFNSLNAYNLEFGMVYLYKHEYLIDNPTYSIEHYSDIITSKDYLQNDGMVSTVNQMDTQIKFTIRFFDMDNGKVMDWVNSRNEMKLEQIESSLTIGLLHVEQGTETDWVERLSSNSHIKFAQLNHDITIR